MDYPIAAGARVVIMAHGVNPAFANRFMVGGGGGAIVATVIMLGMCGMRVQLA
jgi:hypothetical protein